MKHTKRLLSIIIAATLLLGGCQSAVPVVSDTYEPVNTLPPAQAVYDAPIGDRSLEYTGTATLFLPRRDGVRLIAQQETVTFSAARHGAEAVVRALISHPGNDEVGPLGNGVEIHLYGSNPVEVSRDVCTVNLSASVLQLDAEDFYTVCQAITNTVTEFSDIQYVNILVAGSQLGLDTSSTLPAGTLKRHTTEDLSTLWSQIEVQQLQPGEDASQRRLSLTATLYFPTQVGNGILPEVRNIAFDGQAPYQLAAGLIRELSAGAQYLDNVPALPNLYDLMTQMPEVTNQSSGGRLITLRFASGLNEALLDAGVTRSVMMASLTYTLTTLIPEVSGIMVYIGDEWIQSVTPIGIYSTGETIQFANGQQRRSDFSPFLLSYCTLYFADTTGTRLVEVNRPVPCYEARNPRYLIGQLIQGPKTYDDVTGLTAVLPQTLGDVDLIGFSIQNDTILTNFSQNFFNSCQGYTPQQERLMAYALVNTLCISQDIKRVRFYEAGVQPNSVTGEIDWHGEFLKNTGIVANGK